MWLVAPKLILADRDPVESLVGWLQRATTAGYDVVALGHLEHGGELLDPFVIIGALSEEPGVPDLAAACEVGAGRHASVIARELTTLDHLTHGHAGVVLLGRDAVHLDEAEAVLVALLTGGPATVPGLVEHVENAPNLPPPLSPGGPPVVRIDLRAVPPEARGRRPGTSPASAWTILSESIGLEPIMPRGASPTTIVLPHDFETSVTMLT